MPSQLPSPDQIKRDLLGRQLVMARSGRHEWTFDDLSEFEQVDIVKETTTDDGVVRLELDIELRGVTTDAVASARVEAKYRYQNEWKLTGVKGLSFEYLKTPEGWPAGTDRGHGAQALFQCYRCGGVVASHEVYRRKIKSAEASGHSVYTMENLCPRCGRAQDAWDHAIGLAVVVAIGLGVVLGGGCHVLLGGQVNWLGPVACISVISGLVAGIASYFRHR